VHGSTSQSLAGNRPELVRNNLAFVLVRPVFLGNLGSAARVLKNFGFVRLRLVDPPRTYKESEARRMSAGAFDVLKAAEVFTSLSLALNDVSLAIGTTAGHFRAQRPAPLLDVIQRAAVVCQQQTVAFVFGDERNGLTRQELSRCHQVITIPTEPGFPSLNIAQAVAIVAYEMTRTSPVDTLPSEGRYPIGQADDLLFSQIGELLDRIGFSRKYNRQVVLDELRSAYHRMAPSTRELDLLHGILRRIIQELPEQ